MLVTHAFVVGWFVTLALGAPRATSADEQMAALLAERADLVKHLKAEVVDNEICRWQPSHRPAGETARHPARVSLGPKSLAHSVASTKMRGVQPDFDLVVRVVTEKLNAAAAATRLIAIDGPSGSGKSTLARPLAAHFAAPLIQIDDFVTWQHFGAWWPRFEEQVARPLLAGGDARYQARDWDGDEFGDSLDEWRTVRWAPVIVIEGVTSSRRAISEHLSCRLWIEAPADLRLTRGLARDGESHRSLWEQWMTEEAAFFEADNARARADLVIDTSN